MTATLNAQYNFAKPESLAVRVATIVRKRMFEAFLAELRPGEHETILDIGVTADRSYASSNYFEDLYPHKSRIVAAGLDDASFLEDVYPGVRFERADARALPYADGAFDIVHSAAVWEHVGGRADQARMLSECLRVARRGVFLTTPNRWFPIELHTQLPLLHWLPPEIFRAILKRTPYAELADEKNLNLLGPGDVRAMTRAHAGWSFRLRSARLLGWPSNILLVGERAS